MSIFRILCALYYCCDRVAITTIFAYDVILTFVNDDKIAPNKRDAEADDDAEEVYELIATKHPDASHDPLYVHGER